ncbi:patatin-like phospholipase family protein [Variovorax terrae]|uniref:Patatin-like phospholipase family protein n=1 Tax=Variovorax terrae TaxID=2923278 RepID=A0A9X1VQY3_9BURK|nr:patatin-like phospholipase family protein [Variovorax terrae]MCJ0761740.1 patatin-like phospholipase family protein [Variovorax terrae]
MPASSRILCRLLRLSGVLVLAGLAAGCSSVRPWINEPLSPEQALAVTQGRAPLLDDSARSPSMLVAVTLSGGGARAAAFGYGVLSELQNTRTQEGGRMRTLLDEVDVISGVSGGSIIAAYYAAFGSEGLPRFERDFLRKSFQNNLITQTLKPGNLYDLTSPWFGRSQMLARRLDELYQGKTYGDVERRPGHPALLITATDLSLGAGFEFTWDQFELICSNLNTVPLSFAVAASSAVPIVLSPLTLKNYAAACPRPGPGPAADATPAARDDYRVRLYRSQARSYLDAEARPYIHLVDGGLSDNLGVRRLLDRTLAGGSLRGTLRSMEISPRSIRKLVLITVNSERDPAERIDASDKVPGTSQVVDALLFGAGARATQETQEFLTDLALQWKNELRRGASDGSDAFARDADVHVIQVNLRDAPEWADRQTLLQIPTAFSIAPLDVERLIEAGRHVLRRSPEFQALLHSLVPAP